MDDDTVRIEDLTLPAGATAEEITAVLRARGVPAEVLAETAAAVRDAVRDAIHPAS